MPFNSPPLSIVFCFLFLFYALPRSLCTCLFNQAAQEGEIGKWWCLSFSSLGLLTHQTPASKKHDRQKERLRGKLQFHQTCRRRREGYVQRGKSSSCHSTENSVEKVCIFTFPHPLSHFSMQSLFSSLLFSMQSLQLFHLGHHGLQQRPHVPLVQSSLCHQAGSIGLRRRRRRRGRTSSLPAVFGGSSSQMSRSFNLETHGEVQQLFQQVTVNKSSELTRLICRSIILPPPVFVCRRRGRSRGRTASLSSRRLLAAAGEGPGLSLHDPGHRVLKSHQMSKAPSLSSHRHDQSDCPLFRHPDFGLRCLLPLLFTRLSLLLPSAFLVGGSTDACLQRIASVRVGDTHGCTDQPPLSNACDVVS
mmetsp:Transcript_41799/g.82527  ORF Transcript_41799/g.82527 Transcript_41799/m.82527 type:complete len:361 (-) Transcript_41799:494-1576(-)